MTIIVTRRPAPRRDSGIGRDLHPEVRAWLAGLPKDRVKRIRAMQGCLAHVPTSADDFARRKQEEIDLEEAKFRR